MPIVLRVKRQGFGLKTVSLTLARGVLTRRSLAWFTFEPRPDARTQKRLVADMMAHGGLLGFRIQRGQAIRSLEVAGMKLDPDPKVSRELRRVFGARRHEQWVGFPILGKARLLAGEFRTVLRVTFRPETRAAFQLVPVVVAFGNQDLRRHHLLGVSVLRVGRPFADSFIEVVSGR